MSDPLDDLRKLAQIEDANQGDFACAVAEIERLRAQLADSVSELTLMAVECERNEAREALKPFAAAFKSDDPAASISLHDLRMAARALGEE